jgi:uncharacterized protein (DUF302 family)
MSDQLGFEVELPLEFSAATDATRTALKTEGFGILTEIDLRSTFREKLGREFRRFTILGACNPPLAFAAVTADPTVGLLLPCNVTVEENAPGRSLVRLVDPQMMLSAAPGGVSSALREVAVDARARMERVVRELNRLGAAASPVGSGNSQAVRQADA